jgi:FSR family fosmidomycin resistance protein-like MFS transporter
MNRRLLWTLSFGHLVVDLSSGAIPAILPILQDPLHLSLPALSLVVAVLNFTGSVMQPLFGYLGDRRRMRVLLPAGFVMAAGGMALIGFATQPLMLLLLVVLTGFGTAAYHPEASRVAHYAGGSHPASAMSVFSVGGNVGFALGPVLLAISSSLLGVHGTVLFLVPGLAAFLLFLRARPGHELPAAEEAVPPAGEHNDLWAAFLLTLAVVFRSAALFGLITFVPLYAVHHLGVRPDLSGLLDFAILGAGALGTFVGGPIADRVGRSTFVWVAFLVSIPLLYLVSLSHGLWLIPALAASGFALVSTFAVTVVLNQEALPEAIGVASGLSIGLAVGAGGLFVLFLGHYAEAVGLAKVLSLLPAFPFLGALAGVLLWWRLRQRAHAYAPS